MGVKMPAIFRPLGLGPARSPLSSMGRAPEMNARIRIRPGLFYGYRMPMAL